MSWVNWSWCTATALLVLTGILPYAQAQAQTTKSSHAFEQAIFAAGCFWCRENRLNEVWGYKPK